MLTEHLGEIGVTGSAFTLTYVTYLNTYRDRPTDEWPHRRAVFHTIVVFTAAITLLELGRLLAWSHIVHCGRWIRWQTARLPKRGGRRTN